MRLILRGKVVINAVYHFVDSNLGLEMSSKKRQQQKKGAFKLKIEALPHI